MAFRMATPYRHPKTGVYWFRKAVPKALQGHVGATIVQRTLETKDPVEARKRFLQVAADVEEAWATVSVVPDRLTHRQRLALAGEFYRWSVAQHTEDPGRADAWATRIQADLRRLRPSGGRMPAPWMVAEDELARFLAERTIRVGDADMWDLTREAANAALLARRTLLQQANGDYRTNPEAERFPAYVTAAAPAASPAGGTPAKSGKGRLVFDEHWTQFVRERQLALATQKRWKPLLAKLQAFIGRTDLSTTTREEIGAWKQALLATESLSNKTIREGYIASARTFFAWAIQSGKMTVNPCDGITVARDKVVEDTPARSRDLSMVEVTLILSESLRPPDVRMSAKAAAARRWVPWICAYTGARVNEVTQLRRQDLLKDRSDRSPCGKCGSRPPPAP